MTIVSLLSLGFAVLIIFGFAGEILSLQKRLISGLDDKLSAAVLDVRGRKTHHRILNWAKPYEAMCIQKYGIKAPAFLDYEKKNNFDVLVHMKNNGMLDYRNNETFKKLLNDLTIEQADRLAYDTFSPPFYNQTSAVKLMQQEVEAVLRAAPLADLTKLNGVNIGAGGREIPGTLPLDAHRTIGSHLTLPNEQQNVPNTWLSWADNLPFKNESLDTIISLHNLEHIADPIATINHYLDLLKPGGGIGIVIPNYDYCWDHKRDTSVWGHRWSTRPARVCTMYHAFWQDRADLVDIVSFEGRLSFAFILRKKGTFVPFDTDGVPTFGTGADLIRDGKYIDRA
jgi:SAM-dependent methyltransferase